MKIVLRSNNKLMAITDGEYLSQAKKLQSRIEAVMNTSAQHPGIQRIQDIYRKHANRMYHWAKDRSIPADNNFAERPLRGLVIARKVSFGSQSDEGALTRETLMSILNTLRLRGLNVQKRFKSTIDSLAANPTLDVYSLLFSPNSS
ncbi:MAG: transposase [Nitrospirota bacterium]